MSCENDEENVIDLTNLSNSKASVATTAAVATKPNGGQAAPSEAEEKIATTKTARQRFNEAIRLARQMERAFQYAEVSVRSF